MSTNKESFIQWPVVISITILYIFAIIGSDNTLAYSTKWMILSPLWLICGYTGSAVQAYRLRKNAGTVRALLPRQRIVCIIGIFFGIIRLLAASLLKQRLREVRFHPSAKYLFLKG